MMQFALGIAAGLALNVMPPQAQTADDAWRELARIDAEVIAPEGVLDGNFEQADGTEQRLDIGVLNEVDNLWRQATGFSRQPEQQVSIE